MLDDEKGPAELKRSSTSLVTTSAASASQKASRLKSMRIVRYENVMHIVSERLRRESGRSGRL
ncbi:hypothetical protein CAMRE0001_1841 [Campylobacter rectus RM3267]|uniref:Uncharacterized protein n=1 Tax=Campylobacter rectus RM3267 TaxID=553218 RepID=B9CYL5_CAMRE|nr:hypothetical protein CAMRE0001_1841 [Campylobacter rectus RM3267]